MAVLTIMYNTNTLNDLKIKGQPPNIRLHKLKGNRKKDWSITVSLPWCITFKFKNGEFLDVKLEIITEVNYNTKSQAHASRSSSV